MTPCPLQPCRSALAANDPAPQFDTSAVWHLALDPIEKFVLLAYATQADAAGVLLQPDLAVTAAMTGLPLRGVQRLTWRLLKHGVLHPVHAGDPQGWGYRLGPGLSQGRARR